MPPANGRRRARLERTLTHVGISPHPTVVLVLEGPMEMFAIVVDLEGTYAIAALRSRAKERLVKRLQTRWNAASS
jgi:hypothetical protein